jgi:translation initiation factor 2 subunit 2
LDDQEYQKLLDRAFEKMPHGSEEKSDFVIPRADILVQGSKTIIRNLIAITDKARRKPQDLARFLSKELGVPADAEEQRLLINGKFQSDEVNKRIERFFDVYVVCKECHKPDSHLESAGRGMLYFVCEACGARYAVKNY